MSGFDETYDVTDFVAYRFVNVGINVNGSIVLAPETSCDIDRSKETVVERKVIDTHISINRYAGENVVDLHLARGQTCHLYVVEIDDAEDILQVDALQVGVERVGWVLGHTTIHVEVTSELRDLETVDIDDIVVQH